MKFYVYEHWRPDKGQCFYVGKGTKQRVGYVWRRNPYHRAIVAKLSTLGMKAEVRIVGKGLSECDAHLLECERISYWRANGAKLANVTDGGEGISGFKHSEETKLKLKTRIVSEETRAKLSASKTGKKASEETRAKMRNRPVSQRQRESVAERNRARIVTDETRLKISKINKGRKHSDEAKARMSAGSVGIKHSEETRAKMSEARKGIKKSEEHRAKIGAGNRGKTVSAESRARMSEAQRGKQHAPHSEETKAKISAAKSAYWKTRKAKDAA